MLSVEDIHAFYGRSYILQGVSLKVDQGQVSAVLGRNGAGKTTLIRSVMGMTPPVRGEIIFRGEDIARKPPYVIVKKGIGLVPQGRQIFPSLSVLENLNINARSPSTNDHVEWNLEKILAIFPTLKRRLSHKGNQLSGGEQQMLAIGRALMGNPAFLLMDEPSEGLAPLIVQEIGSLINAFKTQGISILLVEQNFNFAMGSADDTFLMNKGKIIHHSLPSELVMNKEIRERYLGI